MYVYGHFLVNKMVWDEQCNFDILSGCGFVDATKDTHRWFMTSPSPYAQQYGSFQNAFLQGYSIRTETVVLLNYYKY